MKRLVFTFVLVLIILIGQAYSQWIINHDPIYPPDNPKPDLTETYIDPKFGTDIIRISNATESGFNSIIPEYSKRQAWNSDESWLLLRSGNSEVLLFDGSNYQFIKKLDEVTGEDVFWHPTNPKKIYYSLDSIFNVYDIDQGITTQLHVFTKYTWINTRAEGNLSRDGRYYAFVGQIYNYSTGDVIFKDIVVYDIQTDTEIVTMPIPQDSISGFDWVSVSPLGNYVVVDYANDESRRYHGVEVYDRNMNFIWQKPLGAGHSDLGIDEVGNEILVMDIYDPNSNRVYIRKFNLANGDETTLIDLSPYFYFHISCRNENRREWCFVSTFDNPGRLTHDSLSWLPFEDEVFALKLDGSGEVQRIAHHHSRRFSPITPDPDQSNYYAEPHATVSRLGNRIIFGSNWEQNVEEMNSVDAYVCDFRNFLSTPEGSKSGYDINISPNPSVDSPVINLLTGNDGNIRIEVFNILGAKIKTIDEGFRLAGSYQYRIDTGGFATGIYYFNIYIGDNFTCEKLILAR